MNWDQFRCGWRWEESGSWESRAFPKQMQHSLLHWTCTALGLSSVEVMALMPSGSGLLGSLMALGGFCKN